MHPLQAYEMQTLSLAEFATCAVSAAIAGSCAGTRNITACCTLVGYSCPHAMLMKAQAAMQKRAPVKHSTSAAASACSLLSPLPEAAQGSVTGSSRSGSPACAHSQCSAGRTCAAAVVVSYLQQFATGLHRHSLPQHCFSLTHQERHIIVRCHEQQLHA